MFFFFFLNFRNSALSHFPASQATLKLGCFFDHSLSAETFETFSSDFSPATKHRLQSVVIAFPSSVKSYAERLWLLTWEDCHVLHSRLKRRPQGDRPSHGYLRASEKSGKSGVYLTSIDHLLRLPPCKYLHKYIISISIWLHFVFPRGQERTKCFLFFPKKGSLLSSERKCASYSRIKQTLRSQPSALKGTIYRSVENLWPSAVLSVSHSTRRSDLRNASKDNYTMLCICAANRPELLPCVKCSFISLETDRRNMLDSRQSSSLCRRRCIICDTVNIYAAESSAMKHPNICSVFISPEIWGICVDKNLSAPHRTTKYLIFFFKKRTMISVMQGARAPDSFMLPCSLSCSVLIFFLDCL